MPSRPPHLWVRVGVLEWAELKDKHITMNQAWRPNLAEIPEQPGVYVFRTARGAVLYVGKALNLRRRIASYFHHRRRQPPKLRRMISRARAVAIHETGSELEALLLESRLIKQEMPPFNQLLTAYVAFPFVKLTLGEPFPRLELTRQLTPDGSWYLGPFPRFEIGAAVLAALQRLFPLRTCDTSVLPGVFPSPCEAFHLRRCVAPCLGREAASSYRQHVDELRALLARGRGAILQHFKEERQRAVDAMFFERAGHLHTLLAALDEATVGRPLALLPVELRNLVVIFARAQPPTQELFCVRRGRLVGRLMVGRRPDASQALETFLTRCYGEAEPLPRSGAAVVDELRIVAGWLHRTRARARWVHLASRQSPADVLEAVMRAMSAPPIDQRC
jgi:DNA polymerase III subunit epsilon